MVLVEDAKTTAAFQQRLTKNIHHIINPQDMVVFLINEAIRGSKSLLTWGADLVKSMLPELGIYLEIIKRVLTSLDGMLSNHQGFAHFGCIYLVEPSERGSIKCLRITSRLQIPHPPPLSAENLQRFHAMTHYSFCVNGSLNEPDYLLDSRPSGALSSQQFVQNCLPLPEAVRDCTGIIYDDKITVSATIASPLAAHLVVGATSGQDDFANAKRVCLDLEFKAEFVPDQVYVKPSCLA